MATAQVFARFICAAVTHAIENSSLSLRHTMPSFLSIVSSVRKEHLIYFCRKFKMFPVVEFLEFSFFTFVIITCQKKSYSQLVIFFRKGLARTKKILEYY
jgi:hypothetical protein